MISFAYPILFALVLALAILLPLRRRRQPAVGHSQVSIHTRRSLPLVALTAAALFSLTWASMVTCITRPQLPQTQETRKLETREFSINVDVSGSMWDPIDPRQAPQPYWGMFPPATTGGAPPAPIIKRIDVAEDNVRLFVSKRAGDRVALFIFADRAQLFCPLTDDHKMLLQQVSLLHTKPGGSTNFDGPSRNFEGLGPLQASIDHLKKYGEAKTKVLIMVTDGISPMTPERFEELAKQMEDNHIKIYVIGIGPEWRSLTPPQIQLFAVNRLGGMVMRADDAAEMRAAIEQIDKLEKSQVVVERPTTHKDIYEYFALLAAACLLLYVAISALLRQNP